MGAFLEQKFFDAARTPLLIQPRGAAPPLGEFLAAYRHELEARLLAHGALLFRGFAVNDVEAFQAFVAATGDTRLNYVYRSTPRTAVTDRVYTSTEYPAEREIPLHNENAYHKHWPQRLAFCCLTAAEQGGETPLADMREVTRSLDAGVLERFATRKVQYIRHYHEGVDLSWQEVFQTQDAEAVADFCAGQGVAHEWLDEGTLLRTTETCQGVTQHPRTGERVFFNQAHLFHVSSLGAALAEAMTLTFGIDRLPRHARYGDGGEIEQADIDAVHAAFRRHAVMFPWQAGDVLWLDNLQVAHGRRPYRGARKVLAALMDPS